MNLTVLFLFIVFILPHGTHQNSVSVPLLDNEKAPLVADLDMTNVQKYIEQMVSQRVQSIINRKIAEVIDNCTAAVTSNILDLSTVDTRLQETMDSLQREVQNIKGKLFRIV